MTHWQRNLLVIWLAQFLSIAGFAFGMPFAPYFIQELGVTDPDQLALWVALFGASTPLALALAAPLWGAIGDRYGQRIMLLRSYLGAFVVLFLMALAPNVQVLILLRLLQGFFTGTVTAAQTLVATQAPDHRSGFALGTLNSSLYCGVMAGVAMGGFTAEAWGYRVAFGAGAFLLIGAFLLVWFGTRERRLIPDEDAAADAEIPTGRPAPIWISLFPLILLIFAISMGRQFDGSFFPLLVQDLHGSVEGAARWTAIIVTPAGLAGLISALVVGHVSDRLSPQTVGKLAAAGAAVFAFLHLLAGAPAHLIPIRAGFMFFTSGLDPAYQAWLAKSTPQHIRGRAFGLGATAKALGWTCGPLIAGTLVTGWGLRSIYVVNGLILLGVVAGVGITARRLRTIGRSPVPVHSGRGRPGRSSRRRPLEPAPDP